MSFQTGVIVALITGFFGILSLVLGVLLNRKINEANALKAQAEARKAEADADKTGTEIKSALFELELKQENQPTDEQKKIRLQAVKAEDLDAFIKKHNEITERYTKLITTSSELQETCAKVTENLKKSEILREYFEERAQKNERNWLETIEELKSCRRERDSFEKAAQRVSELEERLSEYESRVKALEKVLTDNNIPFEHI